MWDSEKRKGTHSSSWVCFLALPLTTWQVPSQSVVAMANLWSQGDTTHPPGWAVTCYKSKRLVKWGIFQRLLCFIMMIIMVGPCWHKSSCFQKGRQARTECKLACSQSTLSTRPSPGPVNRWEQPWGLNTNSSSSVCIWNSLWSVTFPADPFFLKVYLFTFPLLKLDHA